ncbi:MAG: DUF2239 family protein [Armatimonadetes bacterium]|nr:DUF2239 family protein [Armatimonadota bacterium]
MDTTQHTQCTAFEGYRRIASGTLADVAVQAKTAMDKGPSAPVLIFDDTTGEHIEVDYRGTVADVRARLMPAEGTLSDESTEAEAEGPRGPGRPKLGVVAHEVTLLPLHWDWLYSQPGGASVALRKLVEQARKDNEEKDRLRIAQEAAYRFMSALAGNLPNFEEALRAFYNGNGERFEELISVWPVDVRDYTLRLISKVFEIGEA